MRIALLYGKGLDGCGVQRGGVELQNWCLDNGIDCDIFDLVERRFKRAKGHPLRRQSIPFKPSEIPEVATRLEDYDVVIVQSLPSHKHAHSTVISFYDDLMRRLTRPIVVGMMHEIRQANIDCYPLIIPILNECDVVYNFSEKTWFSSSLAKVLPSKRLGERMRRFRLWIDVDEVAKLRRPVNELRDGLIYVGRWTTMKDPRRVLDMAELFRERDPDFSLGVHGIEKSIGAKYDVIEHPSCFYDIYGKMGDRVPSDKVWTTGPYDYLDGLRMMSRSKFTCSFFRLPKDPENYGDRMEYSQIEMIAAGSVPVFDSHYGRHNMTEDGRSYESVDHLAIWSDRDDLPATVDKILEVSGSLTEVERYREAGLEFVRSEFSADDVLPKMLQDVSNLGKDEEKYSERLLLESWGDGAHETFRNLISSGVAPGLGFRQWSDKTVCEMRGKGRYPVWSREDRPANAGIGGGLEEMMT